MAQTVIERRRIAITMGDPNGIGPEIAIKAARRLLEDVEIVLVGDRNVFEAHASVIGETIGDFSIVSPPVDHDRTPDAVSFGKIEGKAGGRAMEAVRLAVGMCLSHDVDAMVTAPISKEAIAKAGYRFPGHTEFIADLCGRREVLMLMVAGPLRVALATIHIPISSVSNTLTSDLLLDRMHILLRTLKKDFGIDNPRIAVLGLNPHAGDGGIIGDEEMKIIAPVIEALVEGGERIQGPFPADGFFGNRAYERFDAVMATYHDQGLIPFKTLSFNRGCNFTAGLSVIRVSPDHGTAFDIAGAGTASEQSLVAAANVAREIIEARR